MLPSTQSNNDEKDAMFLQNTKDFLIYDKLLLNTELNTLQTQGYLILKDVCKDYINQYPTWRKDIRSLINPYKFNKPEVIRDNGRLLIMHNKGRIDTSPVSGFINPKIIDYIKNLIGCQCVCRVEGALTLDANTQSYGKWHRDTPQLFKFSEDLYVSDYMNICLPDYYFTVFIPLNDVTESNGPTEVIPGSHKMSVNDSLSANRYNLLANCGDIIIMNGKLLHRSSPNSSNENRDILYMVFAPSWLHEDYI